MEWTPRGKPDKRKASAEVERRHRRESRKHMDPSVTRLTSMEAAVEATCQQWHDGLKCVNKWSRVHSRAWLCHVMLWQMMISEVRRILSSTLRSTGCFRWKVGGTSHTHTHSHRIPCFGKYPTRDASQGECAVGIVCCLVGACLQQVELRNSYPRPLLLVSWLLWIVEWTGRACRLENVSKCRFCLNWALAARPVKSASGAVVWCACFYSVHYSLLSSQRHVALLIPLHKKDCQFYFQLFECHTTASEWGKITW